MRARSEGRLYCDRKYSSLSLAIPRHPHCSSSSVLDACRCTARLIRRPLQRVVNWTLLGVLGQGPCWTLENAQGFSKFARFKNLGVESLCRRVFSLLLVCRCSFILKNFQEANRERCSGGLQRRRFVTR